MEEISNINRQRWSALWNGIVIGMGVFGLVSGAGPFAVLPLVAGIAFEVMQRKRNSRQR